MSPNLERLYLRAVLSGWHADWNRYYAAAEAEQQARLAVLELEAGGDR